MSDEPLIPVTSPYLPPLDEYIQYLQGIWQRRQLTNHGPLVLELEQRLQQFLGSARVLLLANGAWGLHLALRALNIRGTVITTPFSYVATTSCPLWEGCSVRFADIETKTLTIDPAAVEAAITPDVEAIVATHVYGIPCDVVALERIAEKHRLAVIYDAAHAFGVRYRGQCLLDFGDVSMVSLHATKLFHTAEGGFVSGPNVGAIERIEWMRRFGHRGEEAFWGLGTNAKLSELHAALGLCVLPRIPQLIARRRAISAQYDTAIADFRLPLARPQVRPETEYNYSYYPVIFSTEESLQSARAFLAQRQINTRRYFYPSLDSIRELPVQAGCPQSADSARRVLCLPLASDMDDRQVTRVINALRDWVTT